MKLHEITGKIVKRDSIMQISDSFAIKKFYVEVDRKYDKTMQFQVNRSEHRDDFELLDKVSDGDLIEVQFDIVCKEVQNKSGGYSWFNNLIVKEITPSYELQDEENKNEDKPF